MSDLEDKFAERLIQTFPKESGICDPVKNGTFLLPCELEFDFAWPQFKVAVEIHGGLKHAKSGHRTADGVMRDMRKCNMAQVAGWIILQLTSDQVKDQFTWQVQTAPMLVKAFNLGQSANRPSC